MKPSPLTDVEIGDIYWNTREVYASTETPQEMFALIARAIEAAVLERSGAEPVMYQFRNIVEGVVPSEAAWKEVKPRNPYMNTVQDSVKELLAYRYKGQPSYEVRALYTAPQESKQAEPVEIKEVVVHTDYRQLWMTQFSMSQKLCAALSAQQAVNQQLLEALKIALQEIKATGEAEGYYFGNDPHVEEKIEAAIAAAAAAEGVKP